MTTPQMTQLSFTDEQLQLLLDALQLYVAEASHNRELDLATGIFTMQLILNHKGGYYVKRTA